MVLFSINPLIIKLVYYLVFSSAQFVNLTICAKFKSIFTNIRKFQAMRLLHLSQYNGGFYFLMMYSFLWPEVDQQRPETSGETRRTQVNHINIRSVFFQRLS